MLVCACSQWENMYNLHLFAVRSGPIALVPVWSQHLTDGWAVRTRPYFDFRSEHMVLYIVQETVHSNSAALTVVTVANGSVHAHSCSYESFWHPEYQREPHACPWWACCGLQLGLSWKSVPGRHDILRLL